MRRFKTIAAAAAATAALTAGGVAAASGAHAAEAGCTPISGGRTYLADYGDDNNYVLIRGGDFSSSYSPWTVRSASIDRYSNETDNVTGSYSTGALKIAPGGSATAPTTCVTWNDDRLRFFYKAPAGTSVRVSVKATSGIGSYTINSYVTSTSNDWQLSPEILIPDWTDATGTEQVSLTLANSSSASVMIDDVLVDPWRVRRI